MKKIAKLLCLMALATLVAVVACNEKDPGGEKEDPIIPDVPSYVDPTDTATSVQFLTGNTLLINTHPRATNPYVQLRVTTADSLQKLVLWRVNNGVREPVAELTTFDNSKDFTKDVTELTSQAYENLDSLLVEAYTSLGVAKATLPVEKYEIDPQLDVQASFPGAEGFGRNTVGGRGGRIIYVTNLDDDGEGSLRWAVDQQGPRIIMFKVSGNIKLKSRLRIRYGDVTIAGQSAPGEGICCAEHEVTVDASNVIVRYMRFRMGDVNDVESDAFWGRYQRNVMIDHCSMSWSVDECASFYENRDFTMQWCILSESMRVSKHEKGNHGYGGIWGGRNATYHHNILAHHDSRNPRFAGYTCDESTKSGVQNIPANAAQVIALRKLGLVDYRNNVVYNWGGNSGYGGEGGSYNMVNNYYQPGPGSRNQAKIFSPDPDGTTGIYGKYYVDGNVMMMPNGTVNTEVTEDNWAGMDPNDKIVGGVIAVKSATQFEKGEITTYTAEQAYQQVLACGGASYRRDAIDTRVMGEVRGRLAPARASGNGGTVAGLIDTQDDVGGWCELASHQAPLDSDGDGMPDAWEMANRLNPGDPSDGVKKDFSTVYTNVEVYLNSLVDHITGAQQEI